MATKTATLTRPRLVTLLAGTAAVLVLLLVIFWSDIAAWVRFVRLFESMGRNEQGYPEYRHRETGIVMVRVPGGMFQMGSPADEMQGFLQDHPGMPWTDELMRYVYAEHPRHEVTLRPFLIAKYEITQSQWEEVETLHARFFTGASLPVDRVGWRECQSFCARTGLRFPTEAQWEYACRAGTEGPVSGNGKLMDMAWWIGNSGAKTHQVGQKSPNAFGLFDMHGNVQEWCEDVYDEQFFSKPEASRADPVCASGGKYRVVRGGNSVAQAWRCRSGYRGRVLFASPGSARTPARLFEMTGFRPAFSYSQKTPTPHR